MTRRVRDEIREQVAAVDSGTPITKGKIMEIKEVVKEKYGQAALRVQSGGSSCCGASAAVDGCCDPITSKSL
jgi:hypothetical protein